MKQYEVAELVIRSTSNGAERVTALAGRFQSCEEEEEEDVDTEMEV